MTQGVKWLYLVTLAVWIGSIVFFSFAVAPTVFKTLKPEDAAALIRRIFSKYYLIGIICAAVSIVCLGLLLADRAYSRWPAILSLLLVAGMGGTDLWLRQGVMPHMNAPFITTLPYTWAHGSDVTTVSSTVRTCMFAVIAELSNTFR